MESMGLPSVYVAETENGLTELNAESLRITKTRHVPLRGNITPESIEWVILQCDLLLAASPDDPINLTINSPGGQISSAYHLIDYIQTNSAQFFSVATEMCASAAAQIFASLPKGHRLIMPHASIIIHQPLTASSFPVNSGNIAVLTDSLHKTEKLVYSDLAKWTDHSIEEIADACKKETCLIGQEAIEYGIADQIYSSNRLNEVEVM